MTHLLFGTSVLAYFFSVMFIAYNHWRGSENPSVAGWWLAVVGWICHGTLLLNQIVHQGGWVSADLRASLKLIALVVALLYIIGWRLRQREVRSIGLLLLPLVLVLLFSAHFLPGSHRADQPILSDPLLLIHLVLSLSAFGFFSIALALGALDAFQEHALKTKRFGRLFSLFPPLNALDHAFITMIRWGFTLLTFSIATGAIHAKLLHGHFFAFSHKVVLSWATWLLFATLLVGRLRYGWRGQRFILGAVAGYALLLLAYLGVKFVTEVILTGR